MILMKRMLFLVVSTKEYYIISHVDLNNVHTTIFRIWLQLIGSIRI